MACLLWKLVHIVSVVLFLGNITTGPFRAAHAHRTRDFDKIAATFDGVIQQARCRALPLLHVLQVSRRLVRDHRGRMTIKMRTARQCCTACNRCGVIHT